MAEGKPKSKTFDPDRPVRIDGYRSFWYVSKDDRTRGTIRTSFDRQMFVLFSAMAACAAAAATATALELSVGG